MFRARAVTLYDLSFWLDSDRVLSRWRKTEHIERLPNTAMMHATDSGLNKLRLPFI